MNPILTKISWEELVTLADDLNYEHIYPDDPENIEIPAWVRPILDLNLPLN